MSKRPNSGNAIGGTAKVGGTTAPAPAGLFNSYQNSSTTSYQPPVYYAADQTRTLEDTTKTYYTAEDTANAVLQQMTQQRQQVMTAHDNVWGMRTAAELAKRELEELQVKYTHKKRRLYLYIGLLSLIDLLLFLRILQCHGNFYCFF